MKRATDKVRLRILRFLAGGDARVEEAALRGRVRLRSERLGAIQVEMTALETLAEAGFLQRTGDGMLRLTETGRSAYVRARAAERPFLLQHAEVGAATVETEEGPQTVAVNLTESPLAKLSRIKDRGGRPFLEDRQFRAGERLRSDFDRGLLMPRLGINWAALGGGGAGGPGGSKSDLTDAALAARNRVDRALQEVGPEFADLLIDVCCFLKGLETVELERGWPVRSAKVMLRAALSALARHYAPEPAPRPRRILHWGTRDYRPKSARS
ncbi:DUF6456 domain-containing protein [Aquibium microcysteis]|uniref:DUF6456 domain-containing protein n=1 Tax=Aquibium microcysteis TaxID=675281 RepID=UPI001EF244DE|nr:DUF6456 domain-containing protein [Aquibium microcysteis]